MVTKEAVMEQLDEVEDPELELSIVELSVKHLRILQHNFWKCMTCFIYILVRVEE